MIDNDVAGSPSLAASAIVQAPGVAPTRSSLGRWPGLFFCTAGRFAYAALTCFLLVGSGFGRTANAAGTDPRTVTVVETRTPITLDGVLDEEVWRTAETATDFVQAEPHEGQPATERTEVRLLYDRDALYVGVRCWDATPSALIVNDIRKDFTPGEQDTFELLLDTFADRRNGFVFAINPAGAKSDTQMPTRDATSTRAGTPCGRWRRRWTPGAGPRRSGFRSRRCGSSAGKAVSGARTSADVFAARTRSTSGRRCRACTTCIVRDWPGR